MVKEKFQKSILIDGLQKLVWTYLTGRLLMVKLLGDEEMNVEVMTDWKVSELILIKGYHFTYFENKGRVLQFQSGTIIQY